MAWHLAWHGKVVGRRALLWGLSTLVQRGQTLRLPFPDLPEVLEEKRLKKKARGFLRGAQCPCPGVCLCPGQQGCKKLALFLLKMSCSTMKRNFPTVPAACMIWVYLNIWKMFSCAYREYYMVKC